MTRRERLEARAARRRDWASSAAAKSNAAHDAVQRIADGIPFGQPILVGHHSERRARRDQARMHAGMDKAVAEHRKAERHEHAADELEHQLDRAIFDDDVDAAARLRERISELEAERDAIKARGRGAMPGYVLKNLSANIRRYRQRLEQVERVAAMQAAGDRGRARVMASRYGGTCPDCGERFDRGDVIHWFRVTREAVCQRCGEKPAEPEQADERGDEHVVLCASCGEPLDDLTLAELWEDRDFVQHAPDPHFACFDATEENYRAVRARLGLPVYDSRG